jgi:hypothetical protein
VQSLLRDPTYRAISLATFATLAVAYFATSYLRFKRKVANGLKLPLVEPPSYPLGNVLLLWDYLKCLTDLHACKDPITGLAGLWLADMQAVVVHKADHVNKVLNASNYREPR